MGLGVGVVTVRGSGVADGAGVELGVELGMAVGVAVCTEVG